MTVASEKPVGSAGRAISLVAILGAAYIVSLFLRSSVGVIAPDLAAEMDLTPFQIGVMSSAFLLSFFAVQISLGIAIDRYGPKRCMTVCAVLVIASTLIFALARTSGELIAARVLMGIGTSCYLMAPLALYARRFAPERFASFAGIQLGVGTIGTMLATAPLAFATAAIGWRATFAAVALAMGAVGVLIAAFVAEPPDASRARPETVEQSLIGVWEAWRCRSVSRLFLMQLATYSSFIMVIGLWAGPYLSHIYGYELTARGGVLLVPAATQALGMFAWGWADRMIGSYKVPVLIGSGTATVMLAVLAVFGKIPVIALWVWLALYGLMTAFTPPLIAHGKSLFPPHLVGRGITLLNMGAMCGGFASQMVSGAVIDLFTTGPIYPLAAYQVVFGLQAAFMATALAVYAFSHDPLAHPRTA